MNVTEKLDLAHKMLWQNSILIDYGKCSDAWINKIFHSQTLLSGPIALSSNSELEEGIGTTKGCFGRYGW